MFTLQSSGINRSKPCEMKMKGGKFFSIQIFVKTFMLFG